MSREEWIDSDLADEIRELLNDNLRLDRFQDGVRDEEEEAALFFQEELFDRLLGFDRITGPTGQQPYRSIPVHDWPKSANTENAYLLSEKGNFRVIYVELESLTRTAERNAVSALTNTDRLSAWALEGNYLAVFHERDSDIWHLVTPYEEEGTVAEGRSVLRRFTIGEGENHRTVSENLSGLTATQPGVLSTRIDEAFRVRPVTEDFYDDYRHWFNRMEDTFLEEYSFDEDQKFEKAHRYAHLTLNRLMFFYFLQNKQWLGGRKNFVRWFHRQYEQSDDTECFHSKWLDALFFEGMNTREGTPPTADLPDEVEETIADLPYMNGGLFESESDEERNATLPDSLLSDVIGHFLEQYNFTVTEESPYDVDVAVDPAMLGKIYESLIAEEERDEAGIFYTPRVEVDLMCRVSLFEQLRERETGATDEEVIEFLFSDPQDWSRDEVAQPDELQKVLRELRIVDPACGSGAFLVGMKQVLTELYQKLSDDPDYSTDYSLKEQIINENLYGVDIKDWAIRVAEFRLWLSLVEGEEEIPEQRPVLPNFSFKLKVGDSLVQKLDDEFVALDSISRTLSGETGELFTELKDLKTRYFEGEEELQDEVEKKQVELLNTHIEETIENLSSGTSQSTLDGGTDDEGLDKETEARIDRLQNVQDAIDEAGNIDFFMWDVDFSEVMLNGGFDVVIGNPPYVRQEEIIDQGIHPDRLEAMDSDEIDDLKKQYKNDLVEYVENTFGISPYKRSDIYVYFYFKGIEVLHKNGTLAFITSNSWLDIGYGKRLHEGLLKNTYLDYIIGNTSNKSFEQADVNTYITVANKKLKDILAGKTQFVQLSKPFKEYNFTADFSSFLINERSDETLTLDDEQVEVTTVDGVRSVSISQPSLWRLGGGTTSEVEQEGQKRVYSEETGLTGNQTALTGYSNDTLALPTGSYKNGTWGRFVDAPTLYFELWRDHHEKFDLLGNISEPTYGLKSGTNKFFFVPRPGDENTTFESKYQTNTGKLKLKHKQTGREFLIEPEFWMRPIDEIPASYHDQFDCQHTVDGEILVPDLVLVRNREIITSPIEPNHLNHVHITIDIPRNEVSKYDAGDYVEFGEEPRWGRSNDIRLPDRSSLSGRSPEWYSQPEVNDAYIILTNTFNAQLQFHYNPCRFTVSNRFYYLPVDKKVRPGYLAGYLNSSVGWFMEEVTGRSWTNTLLFDKPEYLILPVLLTDDDTQSTIENAVEELLNEEVGTVFEELGSYNPDDLSVDNINRKRKKLDRIFFDILNFDKEQEHRLYKTIVEMVRDRLMRQPDENPALCETIAQHNEGFDYTR